MTGDEKLALIRQKVHRAKKHISDFEIAREGFLGEEPAGVASKLNPQSGDEEFYITHLKIVPVEFGLMAGDAIHNLRAALDHLAWQLVLANNETPTVRTCFPITDTATTHQSGAKRPVDGMADAAIDAINAAEPYKGGNDALWLLHRLDIADKHHALLTTVVRMGGEVLKSRAIFLTLDSALVSPTSSAWLDRL